jgi:hypothetical protein
MPNSFSVATAAKRWTNPAYYRLATVATEAMPNSFSVATAAKRWTNPAYYRLATVATEAMPNGFSVATAAKRWSSPAYYRLATVATEIVLSRQMASSGAPLSVLQTQQEKRNDHETYYSTKSFPRCTSCCILPHGL